MVNKHYIKSAFRILKLRARILQLKSHCSSLKLYAERSQLYDLDNSLVALLKSLEKYDFIKHISSGSVLFVGRRKL